MKIKIYVNYGQGKILSEKQFAEELKKKAVEIAEDSDEFSAWLDDDYLTAEVFHMTEEEKAEVSRRWEAVCKDYANEDLIGGCEAEWEKVELEV